jgi:uncharacterized RDD family membrane protein YckC
VFWASNTQEYAGFWTRLAAQLIDAIAYIPIAAFLLLFWQNRTSAMFAFVPAQLANFWVFVYLVYRFGGTPGKLLLGIRSTTFWLAPSSSSTCRKVSWRQTTTAAFPVGPSL